MALSGSYSSALAGGCEPLESLAARGDAELPQQALHVRAHGVLGDVETLGDVVRAEVLVEKQENLDLAGAQALGDGLRHARVQAAAVTDSVEEMARDLTG